METNPVYAKLWQKYLRDQKEGHTFECGKTFAFKCSNTLSKTEKTAVIGFIMDWKFNDFGLNFEGKI